LAWVQAGWVFGSLRLQRQSVRSGALLAALYEDEGLRALVLESAPLLLRIPRGKLIEDLPELVRGSPDDDSAPAAAAGTGGANMGKGGGRSSMLDAYTIDLTAEAVAGRSIRSSAEMPRSARLSTC
jgi:type VI secretion system protein VasG